MRHRQYLVTAAALLCAGQAWAGTATYLANEAVLVEHGDTKIVFDPLFDNGFDRYDLLSDKRREQLFAGLPPFDGVDAVFVSHRHADHFSAGQMLDYLRQNEGVRLYAPAQAVAEMRAEAGSDDLFDRVTGIAMANGDAPMAFSVEGIEILAYRVPHAGYPDRHEDVENLVFRVTLDDATTVAHFGDAEPDPVYFEPVDRHWPEGGIDLAMPPYWFFLVDEGNRILDEVIEAERSVGIHVPTFIPDDPAEREAELQGFDLFTRPGEQRDLP